MIHGARERRSAGLTLYHLLLLGCVGVLFVVCLCVLVVVVCGVFAGVLGVVCCGWFIVVYVRLLVWWFMFGCWFVGFGCLLWLLFVVLCCVLCGCLVR